jgi:hypothetical protein
MRADTDGMRRVDFPTDGLRLAGRVESVQGRGDLGLPTRCLFYCPCCWDHAARIGHQSAIRSVRQSGPEHHTAKATAERIAGVLIAAGRILLVMAIVAFIGFVIFAK